LAIQQLSDLRHKINKSLLVKQAQGYACKENFSFQLRVFFDLLQDTLDMARSRAGL
jgi:hypothetical protein